ncbi:MAG: DsbA family protein [Candidatus Magasanikbacteria bacterium]
MQNTNSKNNGLQNYILPISILIAAIMISGSLLYTSMSKAGSKKPADSNQKKKKITGTPSAINKVTKDDHVKGSLDAPVKVIEYSDFECPFCQRFHPTMEKIKKEYGDKVAWVYRHFPLPRLHPSAKKAAEASECVASLQGEDAFWSFADKLFANQDQLGSGAIEKYAQEVGVEKSKLNQCLDSDKFVDLVNKHKQNAAKAGARGTPYTILVSDGKYVPINGAQPYSRVSQEIDKLLND